MKTGNGQVLDLSLHIFLYFTENIFSLREQSSLREKMVEVRGIEPRSLKI